MKALLPLPLALSLVCGALLPTDGRAQCPGPATAQFTRYGTTCDFFFQSSTLTANYDPNTCTLNLAFGASPTCAIEIWWSSTNYSSTERTATSPCPWRLDCHSTNSSQIAWRTRRASRKYVAQSEG